MNDLILDAVVANVNKLRDDPTKGIYYTTRIDALLKARVAIKASNNPNKAAIDAMLKKDAKVLIDKYIDLK